MHYPPPPVPGIRTRPWTLWYPLELRWMERGVMVLSGGLLVTLLAVAWWLQPDPSGLGTHHQLGLPPCSFRLFLGMRCPACGMTTSWAHVVRGQLFPALRANSGGTLLALAAAFVGPWLLASGLRGRWLVRPPNEYVVLAVGGVLLLVIVTDWLLRVQ